MTWNLERKIILNIKKKILNRTKVILIIRFSYISFKISGEWIEPLRPPLYTGLPTMLQRVHITRQGFYVVSWCVLISLSLNLCFYLIWFENFSHILCTNNHSSLMNWNVLKTRTPYNNLTTILTMPNRELI